MAVDVLKLFEEEKATQQTARNTQLQLFTGGL